jgi:hypothetical protein
MCRFVASFVSCFHLRDGTTVFTLSVLIGYYTLNAYLICLFFVAKSARPSRNFTSRQQLQSVAYYPPFPPWQRKQQMLQRHCFLLVKINVITCLKTPLHIVSLQEYGPGSVVGISTGYGLDGPGIESRWGRDFPHLSRPTLGPTSLLYNGYQVFPGGKERPGRNADPSTLSSAVVMKE